MTTAHYDDIVDLSDYGVPEEEDERFHVMMGPGEVKELSLEQLDDFFRLEVIDADTLVWQEGMSGWKPLREVAGLGDEDEQEADEIWHVQMAPGEVKQLTLEQLDDFYRLGVIEDSTPVWQPGMDGWVPLSKVAGIEPEPAASSAAPSAAAVAAATAPFDPFFDKPPVAQTPVAAPFDPFFGGPPSAPVASKPIVAPLPSTAPMALSFTPPPQPARSSGAVRFLFGVAAVAGLLVTLHRNGVLFELAGSLGEQGRYASAEKETFGGPAFGTPRAVEELIESQRSERPNVDLSLLLPKPEPTETTTDRAAEDRAADTASTKKAAAADKKDSEPSAKDKSELEQRMAAALRGQPSKPAPRKATRSAPRAKKSSSDSVIPGNTRRAKGKASEYDPLNGQL